MARRTLLVLAAVVFCVSVACGGTPEPTPTTVPATPTPGIIIQPAPPDVSATADEVPVFELPRADGGTLNLADYLGRRPFVLVFYRGYFCLVCHDQLAELQQNYARFQELGAEVIAISVDTRSDAAAVVRENGLEYPVVFDTDTDVTKSWGLFDRFDDGVAAPATFVFDATGQVIAARVATTVDDRPSAPEILQVLRNSARQGTA